MSTSNGSSRKATTAKRKPSGNSSNGKGVSLDAIRLRLFEPQREKKEFSLDVVVIGAVVNYEEYLTEKFGQQPATNKVVEMLLEDSLKANADFQSWLREKANRQNANDNAKSNGSESEEDKLLENLIPNANSQAGDKAKTTGGQ